MSFGGSVLNMINTLKYNTSILNKHEPFGKLKEHIHRRAEKKISSSGKTFTETQIKQARLEVIREIRREKKRSKHIFVLSFFLAVPTVIGVFYWIFLKPRSWDINYPNKERVEKVKAAKEKELRNFNFYISDGYEWLERNNYKNAVFQFNLALKVKPKSFDANIGLSKTLLKRCLLKNEECFRVESHLKQMNRILENDKKVYQTLTVYLRQFADSAKVNELLIKNLPEPLISPK